jgi:HK97 family phage prohead protease
MEYKHGLKAHIKSASEGIIEAVVSVFDNVDSYNERVIQGAFTKSLETKMPKGVWMHNWELPVAKTLEAVELKSGDPRLPESIKGYGGLFIRGKFNLNTQRGKEAFSDISEGIIDEFSIGYTVNTDQMAEDGVRELTDVNLMEWSPVLVGANPATAILSMKSQMSFDSDADALVTDIKRFLDRTKVRSEMRVKEGRKLSAANVTRVNAFIETVKAGLADLEDMLASAQPTEKQLELRARQLKLKYELIKQRL